MNGDVEAANKNIKKIVQKMTVTYKDWHEMLPFAFHEYCTSSWTSTGVTPYSLVYGMEAVLPIEVQIPSLQIMKEVIMEGRLLSRFLLLQCMVAFSLWKVVCRRDFGYSNGW